MNTVYIVFLNDDNGGEFVYEVFSTAEKANKQAEKRNVNASPGVVFTVGAWQVED